MAESLNNHPIPGSPNPSMNPTLIHLEIEALSRIRDSIQQQPLGADAGDSYLPVRVELAAPLHGVVQQFPKRLRYRFPHRLRQVRIELHDEKVDVEQPSIRPDDIWRTRPVPNDATHSAGGEAKPT